MDDPKQMSEQLFHILLSLARRPRHGYGIIQEVEGRTAGKLGSSTLYSAIKRVREWGWVEEVAALDSPDPRRKYYRLTKIGRRMLEAEARRLEGLVHQARTQDVLPGGAR